MLKTSTVLMVLLVCYLGIKNDVRSNCFVTVSLNGFTYISDYIGGGGDDLKLPYNNWYRKTICTTFLTHWSLSLGSADIDVVINEETFKNTHNISE